MDLIKHSEAFGAAGFEVDGLLSLFSFSLEQPRPNGVTPDNIIVFDTGKVWHGWRTGHGNRHFGLDLGIALEGVKDAQHFLALLEHDLLGLVRRRHQRAHQKRSCKVEKARPSRRSRCRRSGRGLGTARSRPRVTGGQCRTQRACSARSLQRERVRDGVRTVDASSRGSWKTCLYHLGGQWTASSRTVLDEVVGC